MELNKETMRLYVSDSTILDLIENYAFEIKDSDVASHLELKWFVDSLRYYFSLKDDLCRLYIYERLHIDPGTAFCTGEYIIITRISNNGETHILSNSINELQLFTDKEEFTNREIVTIDVPRIDLGCLYEAVNPNYERK